MIRRLILAHTLHAKMLRHKQMALTVVQTHAQEVNVLLTQSTFGFLNAFGNKEKLPLIQRALTVQVEYVRERIVLEFGDLLIVPVVEDDRISYWQKIYVWDPKGEKPAW